MNKMQPIKNKHTITAFQQSQKYTMKEIAPNIYYL